MTAAARSLPPEIEPPDYFAVGERALAAMLGPDWHARAADLHDGIRAAPVDPDWVEARREALRPMSDGPMELISQDLLYLSDALMQRDRVWRDLWCQLALRTPRVFLVPAVGLAMCRADRTLRSLDHIRTQSMMVATVLMWQFAVYDPDPELPDYPYVIRGLPDGAWGVLLSYWEDHADGARVRVPYRTTLYGYHRKRGAPERGECGYFTAWEQFGLVIKTQPNARDVAPKFRGRPRLNEEGEQECWAFHELRLRIPLSPEQVLELGAQQQPRAPRTRMVPPPSDRYEDLTAFTDECERWILGDADQVDADGHGKPSVLEDESSDELFADSSPTDGALPGWCEPHTSFHADASVDDAVSIVARIKRSLAILAQFNDTPPVPLPAAPAAAPAPVAQLRLVVPERGVTLSPPLRRVLERAEASSSERDRERAPPGDDPPD